MGGGGKLAQQACFSP